MRKFYTGFATAMAAACLLSSGAQAESHACGDVQITEMNWASAIVVTAVSKFIMEQGYGCDVTTIPSSTIPSITSVAETGKPDLVTELWATSMPAYDTLVEEGKAQTLTKVLSDGGVEGWWIPAYLAEKHPELTTIEGIMANPELVGGKFHNCPTGWACRTVNDNIATALKLSSSVEIFNHGSGETLAASIAAAFQDEAPWFGYYWAPTSVLGKYKMVPVDFGDYDAEAHECNTSEDCATPGVSAYPPSLVITASTTAFIEANPVIADFMKNVSFTNQEMGEVLAWQEDNEATAEEAAVYFLSNYGDVWGEWLNDAAKEKLSALLQ